VLLLAWAVSNLARCVPAVSEVVRALCGLVELLGAVNIVARFRSAAVACGVSLLERNAVCALCSFLCGLTKLSGGGNDRRPVPYGSC
jgi:hypothetical protein